MRYQNRAKPKPPNKALRKSISVAVSEQVEKILVEYAYVKRISMSTLIMRAISNELDTANPFEHDLNLPEVVDEDLIIKENQLLFNYIKRYPQLNLEHLTLHRADVGIPDKEKLLACYKNLIDRELIVEIEPRQKLHGLPKTMKVVVIAQDVLPKRGILDETDNE